MQRGVILQVKPDLTTQPAGATTKEITVQQLFSTKGAVMIRQGGKTLHQEQKFESKVMTERDLTTLKCEFKMLNSSQIIVGTR